MEFDDDILYTCGPEGGEVAGFVRYDQSTSVITWFMPEGRQRAFVVESIVTDTSLRFEFVDDQARRFVMQPLTPEYYNQHIRKAGQPSYETQAQLLNAYRRTLGY